MKCEHCGWDPDQYPKPEMFLDNWDVGLPPPTLPPLVIHDRCSLLFKIEDEVVWSPEVAGEVPALLGTFKALTAYVGPHFEMTPDGLWVEVKAAEPDLAWIRLNPRQFTERHLIRVPGLAKDESDYQVEVSELTLAANWPMLVS